MVGIGIRRPPNTISHYSLSIFVFLLELVFVLSGAKLFWSAQMSEIDFFALINSNSECLCLRAARVVDKLWPFSD